MEPAPDALSRQPERIVPGCHDRGGTRLSKLTRGGIKLFDPDGNPEFGARVAESREAVARSRPCNAKGKPGRAA